VLRLPALVPQVLEEVLDQGLHELSVPLSERSSPLSENRPGIATGMEHSKHAQLSRFDNIEDTVREAVEIHAAHIGKPDGEEQRTLPQAAIAVAKFSGKLQLQARLLIFVPIKCLL
jgi:hypothetical protein